MAGSRKGEHRGAAKKRIGDAPPRVPRKARLMPQKFTEDYMHQIVAVISQPGKVKPLPREAMLEAQHWFWDEYLAYRDMVPGLIRELLAEQDEAKGLVLEMRLAWVKEQVRVLLLTVVEIARNAAPYFHAKISPDRNQGAQEGTPWEILSVLLQEIDEATRGRPTWQKPDLKLVGSSKVGSM
jgi:hypothetical protein